MDTTYSAPELLDAIHSRATSGVAVSEASRLFRYILQARVALLTRQASYALFALLIWDMLLTMKDEVHLIWPARWTVIKALFLINRYGSPVMIALGFTTTSGFLHTLTDDFCQKWLLTNIGSEQLFLLLVSFVMVFRLHAAWDTNRTLLLTLIALWLAGLTATFFAWVHVLYSQREKIKYIERFNVCFPNVLGLWRLLVPNVCLHFVLLIILIIKAIATPRSKNTAMLIVLLRDGIAFYSITFCATFTAVLIWALSPREYYFLPIYTTWSITAAATSRFLLSLKYSQTMRQTWVKRTDFSASGGSASGSFHRPSGKSIKMESRRDWKGRTISNDSSVSMGSRLELPILRTQYAFPNSQRAYSPQASIIPGTVLTVSPTATSEDFHRYLALDPVNERRGFGGWCWWLLGRGAYVENQIVEVDVSHAEWWDEWEDRGPGWQESKVGRYDGWL